MSEAPNEIQKAIPNIKAMNPPNNIKEAAISLVRNLGFNEDSGLLSFVEYADIPYVPLIFKLCLFY
ncbi:hypothetical protein D3C75_934040 [compost metagenome]